MGDQLDLFAPPKAKRSRKAKAPAPSSCPLHAPECICPACDGGLETDGYGFVHPSLTRGLNPVRQCSHCRYIVTRESWDAEAAACTYEGCIERRSP